MHAVDSGTAIAAPNALSTPHGLQHVHTVADARFMCDGMDRVS